MATRGAYFMEEGSFTWKIEEFSKLPGERKFSETFEIGGYKWRLQMYPKGDEVVVMKDHLSLFLHMTHADALPKGWIRSASFTLIVHHPSDPEKNVRRGKLQDYHTFTAKQRSWGWPKFENLSKLTRLIIDDTLTIEVRVSVKLDVLELFTKNEGIFSPLHLRFDGILRKSDKKKERPIPNQKKRVRLNEDAKQQTAVLYFGSFPRKHSQWIREEIDRMDLKDNQYLPIEIPVPKEFCPGHFSLADVQRAFGHLDSPRDFPLRKYLDSKYYKLLQVAKHFQMKQLTVDLEDCLLNHIKEKLKSSFLLLDINSFMEWMLWSESFDLKRCWSALKENGSRNKDRMQSIIKHKKWKNLSLASRNDIMETYIMSPKLFYSYP